MIKKISRGYRLGRKGLRVLPADAAADNYTRHSPNCSHTEFNGVTITESD